LRRIPIETLLSSAIEISNLRTLLRHGGVLAVPTETFYALAGDPLEATAVRRIFEIKRREDDKALPVLFARRADLARLGVEADSPALDPYFWIWPAPLTVVVPIRAPIPASRGRRTIAVRLPASKKLRDLLSLIGPVTGTSINRSRAAPLVSPEEVESEFRREVELLVDGGKTVGGKPSTLVDATHDPPVVLRPGAYPWPGK
jgi:L-threonylcarbamoyladenylate synthase